MKTHEIHVESPEDRILIHLQGATIDLAYGELWAALCGERRGHLSPQDVADIQRRAHAGEFSRTIAEDYGISRRTVFRIKSGEVYPNITFTDAK